MLANASSLQARIKEPALRVLIRYWDEARGTAPFPAPRDIDAADLPILLPYLIIVDTAERLDDFRFRVAGGALRSGFGFDRTGMTFSEMSQIEDLKENLDDYWKTFTRAVPTYIALRRMDAHAPPMSFSRLLLPVGGNPNNVEQILGGFVFSHTRNRPSGKLVW